MIQVLAQVLKYSNDFSALIKADPPALLLLLLLNIADRVLVILHNSY